MSAELPVPVYGAPAPDLYQRVRVALERAQDIAEVKDIRDKAVTLQSYCRNAKLAKTDQDTWAEIRLRAERKAGDMLRNDPRIRQGRKPNGVLGLGDLKISWMQSSRWQRVSAVIDADFERYIRAAQASDTIELTQSGLLAYHAERNREAERRERESNLHDAPPLTEQGPFDVLYADPPWRYGTGTGSRAIENHYPTMTTDDICALQPPVTDDAVLFLWTTASKISDALDVIGSWGFTYRTNAVWVKDKIGMGSYFRLQHEHLFFAERGNMQAPATTDRPPSVIIAPRGEHSVKPDVVYDLIEVMYPARAYGELFARRTRDGWAGWGNEL